MNDKLRMILTEEEIGRIQMNIKNNETELTVDLHKLSVKQAQRLLKNIIAIDRGRVEMHIIHGYNHGTALKEMIAYDFSNPRIESKSTDKSNLGLTNIVLRAA